MRFGREAHNDLEGKGIDHVYQEIQGGGHSFRPETFMPGFDWMAERLLGEVRE